MQYRPLGSTGLHVSAISFGAGPVSQLLVSDEVETELRQRETLARAFELGVNWIDTAATYGEGRSERNLGRALAALGNPEQVHLATKVRIMPGELNAIAATARASVHQSLRRLGVERVTLLQIHNSITGTAGAQPTSLSVSHVLAPGGLLETLDDLRREGLCQQLGLTGLGEPPALAEVIGTGRCATIQIPYNLLNRSAGEVAPAGSVDADYGNLMTLCHSQGMGVFAIRVLAGGALAGKAPSPHTLKTPFFPLALYEADRARADRLAQVLPPDLAREEAAVRFVLAHPSLSSAIIGFASPDEVSQMVDYADRGPLDAALAARLRTGPAD